MAKPAAHVSLTTAEILRLFPDISRDVLYFLERKGVTKPMRLTPRRGKRNKVRRYDDEDVKKIFLAAQAYKLGWRAERIVDAARHPEILRNDRQVAAGLTAIKIVKDIFLAAPASEIWRSLTRFACEQLDCESSLIYIASAANPAAMDLVQGGRASGLTDAHIRDVISHDPPQEWLDLIRSGGTAVNLSGESLRRDPFVMRVPPKHLAAGQYFSLLAVPVWRRSATKQIRGWLVAENRLAASGRANAACYFDPAMEAVAEMVASMVALVANSLPYTDGRRWLRTALNSQLSLQSFLQRILSMAVVLTGANRGDVVWHDEIIGRGTVITNIGPSRVLIGQAIDDRSISRRVFEQGRAALIHNVHDDPDYQVCDPNTESELCVPVLRSGDKRAVGVINVESTWSGGFDLYDQVLLEELADYTALYGHILETSDVIPSLLPIVKTRAERPIVGRQHPDMKALLEQVHEEQGLDRGIVYLADYRHAQLRCVAVHGYDEPTHKYYDFAFSFSETALATKVFHERRSYFSERVEFDPNVSKKGLEMFNVNGAMVGVPLLFGPTVVGVMVVWSSKGDAPTRRHEVSLMPYANLAVTNIALAQAQQLRAHELRHHRAELESIRDVLTKMATESIDAILRRALMALILDAFDRARVFRILPECFICVDSVSRDETEPNYSGRTLDLDNPYAQMTLRFQPGDRAVIRNPAESHLVDPDAAKFGKPPDLPWAAAPLFVNNVLYGYLACDKKTSQEKIAEADLDTLNVYAALAAQMLMSQRG